MTSFEQEASERIASFAENQALLESAAKFMKSTIPSKYSYNWFWQGRPIIQYPQDIVALQELIWIVKPDLIIETGIAHGGSVIMSASMLALLDIKDSVETGTVFDPKKSKRKVLGVDIDIRSHNRIAIEEHYLASHIQMLEGSSISPDIIKRVKQVASEYKRILLVLDSNHTHGHVMAELEAYAPLVSEGSYCVVFDTIIEDLPAEMFPDRPWEPGNNPKTAVWAFLKNHPEFERDKTIEHKLLVTVAPNGYLRRLSSK